MDEARKEKKKMEEEAIAQEKLLMEADLRDATDDVCPHCLRPVSSYPYVNFHPVLGWLECAACGIIFSPKSLRNIKIRKATNRIEVPKLLVPR